MSLILQLSEKLLYNVKLNLPFENEVYKLSHINFDDFLLEIESDAKKKTFWINIYNSFYQILARSYEGKINKSIYSQKSICIVSKQFSLDIIEHGILRKGKFVIGFGFLYNPFYSGFIKKLQVKTLDYRIHFALNCGAVSCPPILVYKHEKIENQLQLATTSFIELETTIENKESILTTSKLFLWYLGDFGSFKKVKQIIGTTLNLNLSKYKLTFQEYNWTTQLNNYK